MSEEYSSSSDEAGAVSLPWHQVWLQAVTRPSLTTYQQLILPKDATRERAYKWMAVVGLLSYGVLLLAPTVDYATIVTDTGSLFGVPNSLSLLLCAPFIVVSTVLSLALAVVVTHILARILGGKGEFAKLVFAMGAFFAPLTLVNTVFSVIPYLYLLTYLLLFYQAALGAIAANAVYEFGWGKAIIAVSPAILLNLVFIILLL